MPRKTKAGGDGDPVATPAPTDDPTPEARGDEPGNPPAHVVRFGSVRACVWQNDGGGRAWYQVTVNRLYKGEDGRWHSTDRFGYAHLLPLRKALDWAHSWIAERLANGDVPF